MEEESDVSLLQEGNENLQTNDKNNELFGYNENISKSGEFFFWPVLTTPPDKDPKTVCDKKVEQPFRGFLSKTTLQKAVGMFLLATHTLES